MKQFQLGKKATKRSGLVATALASFMVGAAALSGDASAADQCISSQAEATLSECPAGAIATSTSQKKPEVSFKAPPPVSLKTGKDFTKPENPTDSMNAAQRDERRAKMEKKSRQLLVTEIQGLESLFGDTKKNASDRPKLARRLAEGYVELESAATRDQT